MIWLTEEPLYTFLTGLLFVLGLGAFAIVTGKRALWAFSALSLVIMIVLLVVEARIVTDREKLVSTLDAVVVCVRNNDVQGLLNYASPSRPENVQRMQHEMPLYKVQSVSVFRRKTPEINVSTNPPTATLVFQVNATVDASRSEYRYSGQVYRGITLELQKDPDGQWRVIDYSHYDPDLLSP